MKGRRMIQDKPRACQKTALELGGFFYASRKQVLPSVPYLAAMEWLSANKWVFGLLFLAGLGLTVAFSLPKKKGGGACDCVPKTAAQAIEEADLIYIGRLTYTTTNWIAGGMKYSFQIEKAWKRRCDSLMIVNSGWEQDCGISFRDNQEYVVFAKKKFSYQTNRCSGTIRIEDAAEVLALLENEDPAPIVASPIVTIMYWTIGMLGFLSLAFVFLVVMRKRMFKGSS